MSEDLSRHEEEELFEHHRFVADKGQNPLRVDKFLLNFLENTSRNKIRQAADAGCLRINDEVVKQNQKVKAGDVVTVVMSHPPREIELIPQNIPIDIVYEDEDVLVVNKPAGMVVHPGYGNYSGTLVNALVYHFQNLPTNSSGDDRPGLVHRIDKNTSGLLVVAKNDHAMNHLAKQFFDRSTDRKYYAVVWGDFEDESGTIEGNLARSLKNRKVMEVFPEGDYGKTAITHYKVKERLGYVSLIECKLETGRTHQIRIHMKYVKHPLFNDWEYGGDRILKGTTSTKYKQFIMNCFDQCPRHALHAASLTFDHPRTAERLSFECPLPDDMSGLIEKWRNYAIHRKN